ncbi:aldo/keto reductase [Allohahella marinimesophila]|uniref:Aldo/keto reductase n=1 Tax=Allohahella marinimesophila TaxID=1054972 RepID=A0ABP7P5E8_9GAMM
MEYRRLGRTDIEVSALCLGTMTWGEQNTESEGHEQIDYALSQGINFLDTAEMYAVPPRAETYGRTEEIIGTWLKQSGRRQDIILASKIAGPGPSWIRGKSASIDRPNIKAALDDSLRRLQTDYIDLYQLHWPNRGAYHFGKQWNFQPDFDRAQVTANLVEVLETLGEEVKAGRIRHVGLSNETAWGMMQYLQLADTHDLPRMVSIQNEYSLLCRLFEPDLVEISMTEDCGLLAWSPLASGMLSGKYRNGKRPEGSRWSLLDSVPRDRPQAHEAVEHYIGVADRHGLDVCQMALAFVTSRPFVTANIIGATSMTQLKSNIASADVTLSKSALDDIADVYRRYPMPF